MPNLESNAQEVIERLLAAYGVTTQRALAKALNVPSNNVSAWSQRNSVPGSAIIKCVLDTDVDLQWLLNGKLANANLERDIELPSGEALLKEITSNGGKAVLRRIMDAYGFTLQKQLCELLGISSATVSTWVRRNYFPGDVVVTCAIDTGCSLEWLATGKGKQTRKHVEEIFGQRIPHKILDRGVLNNTGEWFADLSFLSKSISEPVFISSSVGAWMVDLGFKDISNGRWLISVNGKFDIYDVTLLPRNKINVTGKGSDFICGLDEISVSGKVIITMAFND
ncbi:helix-turn-helix domain-containing protein [Pantoea sp. SM3640]|uniref:helix-turn-helix domain-containing protein n=1 Tax=Pantoea sp. SM3640 TaxID=2787629 RepID=UPI0018A7A814|nr:helix-turn-helix domain-containing protein [Pantoea sp. SM3640]QPG28610.1 helix-turn-helix domain-containing protein [Pantoea sp. SM3640]